MKHETCKKHVSQGWKMLVITAFFMLTAGFLFPAKAYADEVTLLASGDGWELDTNGKLTISTQSGMGIWAELAGWAPIKFPYTENDYAHFVTSAVIQDGVRFIDSGAFLQCTNLKSVEIPSSVTVIGNYAFMDCSSLTSIEIPSSVTSIGNYAFNVGDLVEKVTVHGDIPPTLGEYVFPFSGSAYYDNKKPIYVPSGKEEVYQTAWEEWKDYIYVAEDMDIDPTADDYADTDIDVLGFTEDAVVYSVDVEWGAMTFQWENSSWDPETHMKKTGAGWKVYDSTKNKALDATEDLINEIKVTNHSNAEVWATLSYASAEEYDPDTEGNFGFENGTDEDDTDVLTTEDETAGTPAYLYLDTADNAENVDEAGTPTVGKAYFMPSGLNEDLQKDDGIAKWTQIGTITVGIETEEP